MLFAGIFLWHRRSDRGRSRSQRSVLPCLRQDRTLLERLPHAQQVCIITACAWINPCFQHKCLEMFFQLNCHGTHHLFSSRPRHRRDSENRQEHFHDSTEELRDPVRYRNEHWKKRDALDIRCCFLCGSSDHFKRDCNFYRGPAGYWTDPFFPLRYFYWIK